MKFLKDIKTELARFTKLKYIREIMKINIMFFLFFMIQRITPKPVLARQPWAKLQKNFVMQFPLRAIKLAFMQIYIGGQPI